MHWAKSAPLSTTDWLPSSSLPSAFLHQPRSHFYPLLPSDFPPAARRKIPSEKAPQRRAEAASEQEKQYRPTEVNKLQSGASRKGPKGSQRSQNGVKGEPKREKFPVLHVHPKGFGQSCVKCGRRLSAARLAATFREFFFPNILHKTLTLSPPTHSPPGAHLHSTFSKGAPSHPQRRPHTRDPISAHPPGHKCRPQL